MERYLHIVVLGQVDGDVQRHARELCLEGRLERVLLVLLVTVRRARGESVYQIRRSIRSGCFFSQHSPAMPNGNSAALLQRSLVDLVQRAVLDLDVVVEAELGVEGGDGRHGRRRQEAGNQASGNHVADDAFFLRLMRVEISLAERDTALLLYFLRSH